MFLMPPVAVSSFPTITNDTRSLRGRRRRNKLSAVIETTLIAMLFSWYLFEKNWDQ